MMLRSLLPDIFSIKTSWRDARGKYRVLFLYSSGIIAGVAALVAILSFRNDVLLTVNDHARELLGADLEIRSNTPFPDPVRSFIDSLGGEQATSYEFSSMVLYGHSQQTRLSQIRAVEGGFPFYGTLKTEPASAAFTYQRDGRALVDHSLMDQLSLSTGDTIRIGNRDLTIAGALLEVPGESAVFSLIGPRVYLPRNLIEGTGLLQRGSRVRYKTWFQFEPEREIETVVSSLEPLAREYELRFSTVESQQRRFGRIVDNLGNFLGLIGFVALMLGGLGVASAVYVYIKRNSGTVAILRCLGASSKQTISLFTLQILFLGVIGAITGTVIGLLIQRLLPLLFADFLPFAIVQQISIFSLLAGFGTGIIVSMGFALLPLASINKIPPLLTLKEIDFSPLGQLSISWKAGVAALAVAGTTSMLALLLNDWLTALIFTTGLAGSILLLLGISNLLIRLLKVLRLQSLPYVWRQGVSNLFRPNNQTAVVLTTLGMGVMLIGLLYLSQEILLERIRFQTGDEQPNLVFYDIQSDQNAEISALLESEGATILQNVPIVSMRLTHLKGRPVREVRDDTTAEIRSWTLTREYRVTYRDHLTDAETLLEGEWIGEADGLGSLVPISLGEGIAEDLGVSVGDALAFDVQGVPLRTRVASIREIDFQRPQPNFFVLFPAGVLEEAPQFYATVLRTGHEGTTAGLQQLVVQTYPNVSAIDIGLVLQSVQQFLDKVAVAIRFMALFTLLTGLIVLGSSIAINRRQRIRESVLLRTIGASKSQIGAIQLVEYACLGLLAGLAGMILAAGAGWMLARFWFELPFAADPAVLLLTLTAVVLLTTFTGFFNLRGTLDRKPLEVLRLDPE